METIDRGAFAMGLVRVVALHDEATATHLRATAALARRIATSMQIAMETVQMIELAGLLHDVGKVGVSRDLLGKPAELSVGEWIEMRRHAEQGSAMLERIPTLADLAPIVRAHHEHIDGTGYPDRLRGEDIPLEARIVSVADAFHALTTDRPYRRAVLPHARRVCA
jgi:putative nucleotidyltransferase with HDIG domain